MWFTGVMLYLVRHGRTDANAAGLLQGRLDLPLDAVGREQAAAIAGFVGGVDEVISSSLLRARETAAYFGDEVTIDDRWIELSYGEFEGMPASDVPADVWQEWRTNTLYAPDGGESFGEVDVRVRSACNELGARLADRDVVVVSHMSPIKAAVAWALDVTMGIMFHCHLDQASVCTIDMGRFGPILHGFNHTPPDS